MEGFYAGLPGRVLEALTLPVVESLTGRPWFELLAIVSPPEVKHGAMFPMPGCARLYKPHGPLFTARFASSYVSFLCPSQLSGLTPWPTWATLHILRLPASQQTKD